MWSPFEQTVGAMIWGVNMTLGYSAHCPAVVGTDVSLWHKFEFDCFGSASVYGLHITKYLGSLFPPPLQLRQGGDSFTPIYSAAMAVVELCLRQEVTYLDYLIFSPFHL